VVARRRTAAAPLSRRSPRSRARPARRRPAIKIADPGRVFAGAVALVCAVALGWISIASSPAIASIDVVGARHVRIGQAIAQSGLLDTPAFGASAAAARVRLRTLPAVADARVDLMLPSSARITLVEREAIGRWVASDGLEWFVDADGVLFPSNDPYAPVRPAA
jgi:cell division septal protein FtsQ